MVVKIKETSETIEVKYSDGRYEGYSEVLKDTILLNREDFEIVENIKKLFTCKVRDSYAGGMCLIAADNIDDAKKILKEKHPHTYSPYNVKEIGGAFINSPFPYPYIVEEDHYFE